MFKYAFLLIAGASAVMSDTELIKDGEGYKECTYRDTKGIRTVCVGFNLERGTTARNLVTKAGGNYDNLMAGGCTTKAVCDKLLNDELYSARQIGKNVVGTVSCKAAQDVVTDLAYNLGQGGLSQFKKFKAALLAKNWSGAAAELQNSSYCGQVGRRCTRNMNQIKTC